MATPRVPRPYLWVTWLSGVLAGSQPCVWQSAFKANFKYDKIPDPTFDSAAWSANHAEAVRARAEELARDGWRCRLEDENAFRIDGRYATLAGKPDIMAYRAGQILVSDIKTGKKKDDHWWQVLVYLQAWPLWAPQECDGTVTLSGEVVYPDVVIEISANELTASRSETTWSTIKQLASIQTLTPVPTERGCRYCDIPVTECPSRFDVTPRSVSVSTARF